MTEFNFPMRKLFNPLYGGFVYSPDGLDAATATFAWLVRRGVTTLKLSDDGDAYRIHIAEESDDSYFAPEDADEDTYVREADRMAQIVYLSSMSPRT